MPVAPLSHFYTRRQHPPSGPLPLPKGVVPVSLVINQHGMTTRAKAGYHLPALYHASPPSPVQKTFHSALADPN
jgi:hypothetical protein